MPPSTPSSDAAAAAKVLDFESLDPADVVAEPGYVSGKNSLGHIVRLRMRGGGPVAFQAPLMPLSWDAKVRSSLDQTGYGCNVALSFVGDGGAESRVGRFSAWLSRLHVRLAALALADKNSRISDPKKQLKEIPAANFAPFAIEAEKEGKTFPASFIAKVDIEDLGPSPPDTCAVKLKVFDVEENELDLSVLTKGTKVAPVVRVAFLFVAKSGNVTCRFETSSVMAIPVADSSEGCPIDVDREPELQEARKRMRLAMEADAEALARDAAYDPSATPPLRQPSQGFEYSTQAASLVNGGGGGFESGAPGFPPLMSDHDDHPDV